MRVPYCQIRNYMTVWYRQIRKYMTVQYCLIRNYMTVPQKKGERGEGLGREGEGGSGRGAVGSRAGGDNRKRARSAKRRIGMKARPTAGAPAPGSRVRASFP